MRVAEVTYDQAAALDPALPPDTAIAVRFGSVRAFVGPLPAADAPVPMLVGELRDVNGLVLAPDLGSNNVDNIRTAVATCDGLRRLLDQLGRIATHQKPTAVPTAKTGAMTA
jgi:hypothetical protein